MGCRPHESGRILEAVVTNQDDVHARHTPEQIGELQDALSHVSQALDHLLAEILDDFDDRELDHAVRHLKEARLWLNEILINAGHEPEEVGPHVDPEEDKPTPIH
jgi:hypothetical protein